ncbi:MAG: tyrosinase family protein, partial [Bacteroidota bacterium]
MQVFPLCKKLFFSLILLMGLYSVSAQCPGRRADINSLTAAQRVELRDLIIDYLNEGFDPSASGVNQYPNVAVYGPNAANFLNGMEEFLTWHRAYIQGLENYLLSRGFTQYVPLPKWDPGTAIPNEFFNGASVLGPSTTFPPLIDQTPASPFPFYDFTAFENNTSLCNFASLDALASGLQIEHDLVDLSIGGSMNNNNTAPGTAVFWLFHSWLDDLYYCYQDLCLGLTSDVWSADDANDVSNEPYPKPVMWVSDDIWVRNSNDGFQNQTNQTPEYVMGSPVYVYLKVRNDGDLPNEPGVGTATVYWAKASTNLSWVFPWTGGNFPPPINLPAGGPIGTQSLRSINQDYVDVFDINQNGNTTEVIKDFTIYEFEWFPPNPDDYLPFVNQIGNGSHEHFCLLARIEEPGGFAFPETTNLAGNVNNNDNIVWKNITLKNDVPGLIGDDPDCVFVGNFGKLETESTGFIVNFPSERDAALLNVAAINFSFSAGLNRAVRTARRDGFRSLRDGTLQLTAREARIDGLRFAPQQVEVACLQIVPRSTRTTGVFNIDLIQTERGRVVGGERYTITLRRGPDVIVEERNSEESAEIVEGQIEGLVSIFPNPATSEITILSQQSGNKQVRIFSHSGQ